MRLAVAIGITKNAQFRVALDRIFQEQRILQSQLKKVEVGKNLSVLSIVLSDHPINYFKTVELDPGDGIYQIIVGYDLDSAYPQSDDDKVIRMFAGWLRRVFQEVDGYAAKRADLLKIVCDWEEQAVLHLSNETVTGA